MMQNKKIIGITGGTGCGKSYISAKLAERGIPVIDADAVGHSVMNEDKECMAELENRFGGEIFESGILNRKKLGKIVFSDSEKLAELNKISHKYILARISNMIEEENSHIICVDGAVLIESGFSCDKLIGVLAEREIRKKRIMSRDGIDESAADARINSQQKDDFYKKHCDFIVYNNGGAPDVDYIIKRMTK